LKSKLQEDLKMQGAGGGVLFQDRDKTELLVIIGYVNNGVPMIPMHDNEDQQSF